MAPLKISQIVSFSNEDPLFPASNLAKQGTKNASWKCKDEGEKQAWVLCKLAETSVINSIDIGNAGSAFVEVQVGRTGMNTEDFRVLLVASSFMSPADARVTTNSTRVRMFSKDKLSKDVAEDKWDLVKFVCTQPFNSHVRYGLSFVTVTGPSLHPPPPATPSTPATTMGAFKLKEDSSSSSPLSVGSYFAKRKMDASDLSPAAALRSDATLASLALKQEDRKRDNEDRKGGVKRDEERKGGVKRDNDGKKKGVSDEPLTFYQLKEATKRMGDSSRKKPKLDVDLPKRNSLPGESNSPPLKERKESPFVKDPIKFNNDRKEHKQKDKNIVHSAKKEAPKKEEKAKKVAKFEKLFDGVTFTISGFQNPLRGDIRGKALEMGAKYKGDWDSQCTHLICAFANTPKFNQVKGKGKIVTKNWIEESYRKRIRLPWRRFHLDKADRGEESEEEIWDETLVKSEAAPKTPTEENEDIDTDEEIKRANVQAAGDDSDENTDDEIERIKKEQVNESEHKKKKDNAVNSNGYDEDTDEEIESVKKELKNESEYKVKKGDIVNKNGYDENADEEIEDIKQEHKVKKDDIVKTNGYDGEIEDKSNIKDVTKDDQDEYDADTDIDEEELPRLRANTENLEFDKVETYFSGKQFFLYGEFPESETSLMTRYIVMFGGQVRSYMASHVNYIITKNKWDKKFEDARKVNKEVVFIKPEWIFSCTDKRRIVSTQRFLVEER